MAGKQISPSSVRRATRILCKQQCRSFASTPSYLAAGASQMNIRGALMKNMSKQKSMQSQMQNMKRGDMPDDLGRLPETLIKPEYKDLPSIFSSQWKRRLRIEWRAVYQKTIDFLNLIYQTKWDVKRNPVTRKRVRLPMYLRDRYVAARDLHSSLYKAIAQGDQETIDRIACMGLRRQLQIKLDRRRASESPNEVFSIKHRGLTPGSRTPWLIHVLTPPFFKSTRIIADRIAPIPMANDASIRQVVVEIKSKQWLQTTEGKPLKKGEKTELVVIQKLKVDGQEEDWKIWGTTKPSTKSEITALLDATNNSNRETFGERMGALMRNSAEKAQTGV